MHFQEFFRVALQTSTKIHKLRQSLLKIGFSVYALYRELQPDIHCRAPHAQSVLNLMRQHKLMLETDSKDKVERMFGIAPGAMITLGDMVRFLNADERFQVSVYGDRPLNKRIIRKVMKLIRVELLLMELVDNYRRHLKQPKSGEMIVEAFHQIDFQRHYFINPSNLLHYVGPHFQEGEVLRLLEKLWRVRAVPFLDFYQFFIGTFRKESTSGSKVKSRRPTSERKPTEKSNRSKSSGTRSRGLSSTPTLFRNNRVQ